MDLNAPYYPEYDAAYADNPSGRSPLTGDEVARLADLTGLPLAEQLGHSANLGPQVCFERPKCSPCLDTLKETYPAKYREALAIIRKGARALAQKPRADMEGFVPVPEHQRRQEKYRLRREIEARNRDAILRGEKYFDRE